MFLRFFILCFLWSCASSPEKKRAPVNDYLEDSASVDTSSAVAPKTKIPVDFKIGAGLRPLTFSVGKGIKPLFIRKDTAGTLVRMLSSKPHLIASETRSRLVAQRAVSSDIIEGLSHGRKWLDQLLRKRSSRSEIEEVSLELGIWAIKADRLGLARYFLTPMTKSKFRGVRSEALNSLGVVSYLDKDPRGASRFFKESLKVNSRNLGARLNLGYLALAYGDARSAGRYLGGINRTFGRVAAIQVARLRGNFIRGKNLCRAFERSSNPLADGLISCALLRYQGFGDLAGAKKILSRAQNLEGASPYLRESSLRITALISQKERQKISDRRMYSNVRKPKPKKKATHKKR